MQKILLLALLLSLAACARQPISAERQKAVKLIGFTSFLDEQLALDLGTRSFWKKNGDWLDIRSWQMKEKVRTLLLERLGEGHELRPLELNPDAMMVARDQREGRWKRSPGDPSNALLSLLFEQAEAQGMELLFVLHPMDPKEFHPLFQGQIGIACTDPESRHATAYPYFKFQFTLWEVKARKRWFVQAVGPELTRAENLGDCLELSRSKEPEKELEAPVTKALGSVLDQLFSLMGWARKPNG